MASRDASVDADTVELSSKHSETADDETKGDFVGLDQPTPEVVVRQESAKLYEAAELSQNYNVSLVQGGTDLKLGFRVTRFSAQRNSYVENKFSKLFEPSKR